MTSGEYFKSIKIIHIALLTGVVFFMAISFLLQLDGFGKVGKEVSNILLIIISIFSLFGIIASNIIFKNKVNEISKKSSLKIKMMDYRSALIVKLALIEGPSFFSVVAFLITGEYIFLGIALILIIVFLIYTPGRTKLKNDLALSKKESEIIDNPDTEIV